MDSQDLNAGLIQADTLPVSGSTLADLDEKAFEEYFQKRYNYGSDPAKLGATLISLGLAKEQQLTLAGVLLFGKQPQRWLPVCMIKAVAFPGTSIADIHYLDSEDIYGTLQEQFQRSFSFIKRNLHHVQNGRGFNTLGELEVPAIAIEELLVNALMHRDYFASASIRILAFRDRIEIISPGHLPDNISTDEIRQGKTNHRNPTLSNHAAHLLPYRGLGSGVHRPLEAWPQIDLQDHRNGNEFRGIVARPQHATDSVKGQVIDPVTPPVRAVLQQLEKYGELSNAQLREHLKINDRRHVRKSYIDPSIEAGLIEMAIPDKPNSSQQRYRLTAAGQQLLQQQDGKGQQS